MLEKLYSTLSRLGAPFLRGVARYRVAKGKEIKTRFCERYGIPTRPKPQDKEIVWIHAASNGEALSALPLIDYLLSLETPIHILITTMTVTSAELVQKRTDPAHVTHQFIPYDHPSWIQKFHDFWDPKMVIWTESELWPNHLNHIKTQDIPAILANARLSDKSVKKWVKATEWFAHIMATFDIVLAQTDKDMANIQSLGIANVTCKGNLKDLAPALPYDHYAAEDIRAVIESRPTLLFASTHAPEEDMAVALHQKLKTQHPNLLSIIIPRHPKRGEALGAEFAQSGLNIARRSLKMSPRTDTDIYVADTLGEMGLFYHLCPIVFVGNSMNTKPGGGHNLLEPAWHHCAIISGDDLFNFSEQAIEMPEENACVIVHDKTELSAICHALLKDETQRDTLSNNAYNYASGKHQIGMERIIDAIKPTCQKAGIV